MLRFLLHCKYKLIGLISVVLMGVILYKYDPAQHLLIPKCPFKFFTGLNCPGCGFQRAVHAILHGEWSEAISYNYYIVVSWPYAFMVCVNQWIVPNPYSLRFSKFIEHKVLIYAYVVTFFLWFVIRNVYKI